MKATLRLRKGVSLTQAVNMLQDLAEKEQRIMDDAHTNKHYILKNGRMWKIGDGTGKYWDLLCNSTEAHRQAWEMMR